MSDNGYEFMCERPDVHWFCGGCEAKVVESINNEGVKHFSLTFHKR